MRKDTLQLIDQGLSILENNDQNTGDFILEKVATMRKKFIRRNVAKPRRHQSSFVD